MGRPWAGDIPDTWHGIPGNPVSGVRGYPPPDCRRVVSPRSSGSVRRAHRLSVRPHPSLIAWQHEAKKNAARSVAIPSPLIRASAIARSRAVARSATGSRVSRARGNGPSATRASFAPPPKIGSANKKKASGKRIARTIPTTPNATAARLASENHSAKPVCKIESIFCNP